MAYPRFTNDIDFLVRPSVSNGEAVVAVLRGFGFGSLDIKASDFDRPERVVQIGVPPNRIDMITSITGVDFDQAWEGRVPGELDGIPVQFIGFEDLIRNKEAAARPKDLGDADELRKRKAKK